ncbi:DUF4352 domain-containing protein [Cryptosporangium sp. NPDC048952]|uniref:DUF4352 domain-containing protein n=1 Tax=Cryptosporangium sp. NPDC048952 TaxID=3363961 RepID=UPI0037205C2A
MTGPAQQSFPQQPPYGYGPPPKKKSKWPWFVLGGVVLLLVCCGGGVAMIASGSNDDDSTAINDAAASATASAANVDEKAPAAAAAKLGSPVRDGKFEFVVSSVKCGATKVGGEYANETAQGQFCLVAMTVKNIGDEPQSLASSVQKAFNASGQEYTADDSASLYVNEDQQVLFNEINPGNQVKGTIVFDIPKGQKLVKLELHDSAFSGGVEVTV